MVSQSIGYQRKLKVLFVNHTGKVGGAEVSLLTLLDWLNRLYGKSIQLMLAAPDDGDLLERAERCGVIIFPTNWLKRLKRPSNMRHLLNMIASIGRGSLKALKLLHSISPHIVHCNSLQSSLYFVLPTAFKRLPLVWHCRDLLMPKVVARFVGAFCDAIISISSAVAKELIKLGISERKVRLIYNAVDVSALKHVNDEQVKRFREACGVGEDGILVGMIAHMTPWKRHDLFIRMASSVAKERKDVRFVIVGGDIFEEQSGWLCFLSRMTKELSLEGALKFVGECKDIAIAVNAIDILVHPSPTEPFGRAIAEAMAVGKAVVAINAFGPAELIKHQENGLLVPSATPEALSKAVLRLVENEPLRLKLGEAAAKFVQTHLSPQLHAEKVFQLWLECSRSP